jgi:hypothetical protein
MKCCLQLTGPTLKQNMCDDANVNTRSKNGNHSLGEFGLLTGQNINYVRIKEINTKLYMVLRIHINKNILSSF